MVGSESKCGSLFSWADEVEKEEAAAGAGGGQAQVQQKQKPNPFGSARPREIVLQEKGIDWRKLDLHLQQPSPCGMNQVMRSCRKKCNPPQTKTTILNSKQEVRFKASYPVSPQVILTTQVQSPKLFDPPLRYPPKYVAGFLYDPGLSTIPNALDSGYQHIKIEKENRFQDGRKFHNLKSEPAMCGNRSRTTTELVQDKEAQQKGRNRIFGRIRSLRKQARSRFCHKKGRVSWQEFAWFASGKSKYRTH